MSRAAQWAVVLAGVLALAGIGIALYLSVVHYADQPIVCSGFGDCEYVNSSEYADVGGIPVAVMGVGAYAVMGALAAYTMWRGGGPGLGALWGAAAASFAFSIYLTYIELFVLDAICIWCVASAAVATSIFALVSLAAWRASDPDDVALVYGTESQ